MCAVYADSPTAAARFAYAETPDKVGSTNHASIPRSCFAAACDRAEAHCPTADVPELQTPRHDPEAHLVRRDCCGCDEPLARSVFELTTASGIMMFSCMTEADMQAWVEHVNSTLQGLGAQVRDCVSNETRQHRLQPTPTRRSTSSSAPMTDNMLYGYVLRSALGPVSHAQLARGEVAQRHCRAHT